MPEIPEYMAAAADPGQMPGLPDAQPREVPDYMMEAATAEEPPPQLPSQEQFDVDRTPFMLDIARDNDPDRMAEVYKFADEWSMSPEVVRDNFEALITRNTPEDIAPSLASYLATKRYADVSHDDVDTLTSITNLMGAANQGFMDLPRMILHGTGVGIEVGARMLERALPQDAVDYLNSIRIPMQLPSDVLKAGAREIEEVQEYLAPTKDTFATEVTRSLSMVGSQIGAALIAPWSTVPSMAAMGITEQAERQEGVDPTFTSDMALINSAVWTATVERFGLEKLMNRLPPEIGHAFARKVTDVVIGAGYEAATEVIEGIGHGLIEKYATNPDADIFQGWEEEAKVAGTVGGIVRAILPSYRGKKRTDLESETEDLTMTTENEQAVIDEYLKLAQSSKTLKRDVEAYKAFEKSLPMEVELYIHPDAFEGMITPDYITDQIDGTDKTVRMSVGQLLTDMPTDVERLRPHMRLSEETYSQAEMASAANTQSIRELMEQADANAEVRSRSREVHDNVVEQLIGTGRMDAETARISAEVVPAYVATKAADTGMTVEEVYKMMGLVIEKKEKVKMPKVALEQDFGETTLDSEVVEVDGTGQTVTITEKAQRRFDQTVKRRNVVNNLIECING